MLGLGFRIGKRQYFGVGSLMKLVDGWWDGGIFCLLWGEPGVGQAGRCVLWLEVRIGKRAVLWGGEFDEVG